ncbi:MAG: hypothetical protein COA57_00805 [Flavobacteriales bacterium]|nr:MAG: hypothetical protein COA57_00805 [Flavobacteriales bacterium]
MITKNSFMKAVFFAAFFAFMLAACSSGGEQEDAQQEQRVQASEEQSGNQSVTKAQQVFYSLPSPFELASLLKHSGAKFNKDILSSPDKLTDYTTSASKAINLGIYGADLSYASIFGQTQDAMSYLKCVKTLTDELGISDAFDKTSMDRIEANKEDNDSISQIVSEAYLLANSYLKDSEREHTSTFILAGGLIEGLYIATTLASDETNNEELMIMVADQKFAIENLTALLSTYEEDDAKELLNDLSGLKAAYDQLEESETAEIIVETNTEENKTVIGGDDLLSITPEQFSTIIEKVTEIRTKYIQ